MNPSFSHIKMVAIDCDETLVRSDNTVSAYTVDVLHRLQQKGIGIIIATGRMYQTAKPIGLALQLGNVPMILFSGGLIQELETGYKLFEQTVPIDVVHRVFQLGQQYSWHIQSYVDDHLLCHHKNWQSDHYEQQTGAVAEFLGDTIYTLSSEPNKLIAIDTKEGIDIIIDILTPLVGNQVTLVRSQRDFLEITAPNVSKGRALARLALDNNLSFERIADTDYEMTTDYGAVRVETILFHKHTKEKDIYHKARKITYQDKTKKGKIRLISLLTNDFQMSVEDIIAIYKRRWQIETLFKQIKQNFPLRYFYGESANATSIPQHYSL